jgi:hypothetical protein
MEFLSLHEHGASAKQPVDGRALDKALHNAPPARRALTALTLTNGVSLTGLTRPQAARLAAVSPYSLAIVGSATADEREALQSGKLSLRAVRALHTRRRNTPSPADVEAFIHRFGFDAVMSALERMTSPTTVAAE